MHALSGELDVYKMGGLRRQLPITAITFLVAALAIAGVWPFAGFYSKDAILEAAFAGGHYVVWFIGLCAAALTAFYVFRAYFLAFEGESRVEEARKGHHLHESPPLMTVPLIILAILSAVGGFLFVSIGHYLEPALAVLPHGEHHLSDGTVRALNFTALAIALTSIGCAYFAYLRSPQIVDRIYSAAGGLFTVLWNKYYVDEIYETLILNPYMSLSKFCWRVVDTRGIDAVVNGVGWFVGGVGGRVRKLQTGNVQAYALIMLVGAACIVVALFGV
jgi:NADH-quinone oxidoreductase subunit L